MPGYRLVSVSSQRLRNLVQKYRTAGPRYTSYPTAVQFTELSPEVYADRLHAASQRTAATWSVYVHIPFCRKRCTFCACSVIPTTAHDKVAAPYVQALLTEAALVGGRLGARRKLAQLHLGGGTPSYLHPNLLRAVLDGVLRHFELDPDLECSIELDPRVTTPEHLDVLAEAGVNRVSLGVQDFDARVQSLIGRAQSVEQTEALVQGCRDRGIGQVNVDLVYGLPGQTLEGLLHTAQRVLDLGIDRVALYGYAHVPWMASNQRSIDATSLPAAPDRLEMFLAARERFEAAGYVAIGLDHFARPADPLTVATEQGRLHRNFMGYTVRAGDDLIALGVTGIGDVDGAIVQNTAKLSRYAEAVQQGRFATARGLIRSPQDRLRGKVIADLMCRHRVNKAEIEQAFGVPFDRTFERERARLHTLAQDGLVVETPDELQVTELGRPFVRNIAMAFDAYLKAGVPKRHSATL